VRFWKFSQIILLPSAILMAGVSDINSHHYQGVKLCGRIISCFRSASNGLAVTFESLGGLSDPESLYWS
jgi:hypothetical protein